MDSSTVIAIGRIVFLTKVAASELIFEHLQAMQMIRRHPTETFNAATGAAAHIRNDPSVSIWIAEYRMLLETEDNFELPPAAVFEPLDLYLKTAVIQIVKNITSNNVNDFIESFRRAMTPYFQCSHKRAVIVLNHLLRYIRRRNPAIDRKALISAGIKRAKEEERLVKRRVTRIKNVVFCASETRPDPIPRAIWERILDIHRRRGPQHEQADPESLDEPTEEIEPKQSADEIESAIFYSPQKIAYLVSRHHVIGTPINRCFELQYGIAVPVAGSKVEVKFDDIESRLEPPTSFGPRSSGTYYIVSREDVAAVYGIATIRAPLDSLKIENL